jgi:acetyltransferase-like isoleucine patch superfamily enzyme
MVEAAEEQISGQINHSSQEQESRLTHLLYLCKKYIVGGIRLANAAIRLRNCAKVGRFVTVRGSLQVEGQGTIIVGDRVKIWSHIGITQLSVGKNAELIIGDNTFINTGVIVSVRSKVHIGKNCQIANQVIIMDNDFHGVEDRDRPEKPHRVIIEDDVWLATRCTILKGITIGKGAVVAAGAVVTKDVAPYTLVGGVPAKVIRHINKADHDKTTKAEQRR